MPAKLAACLYTLVTALFFAPAGRRLLDEQIGHGDNLESLWNAWWVSRSLFRLENPWWTDLLFAPYGTPLVWHSLAPISSAVVAALGHVVPVHVAYNAVVMAALPIAGLGGFVLCRHVTRDGVASFVGGLVLMLSPFVVSKTLGHVDLLYAGLLPFFYVGLLRAVESEAAALRRRSWALAAVSLGIVFTASPNVAIFAANLALFELARHALAVASLRAACIRFARVLWPTLALALPYVLVVAYYWIAYDYPPRAQSDPDYDPELVSFLLPFTPTSVYSGWPRGLGLPRLDSVEAAVYLGWLVLPLALAGLWARRGDALVRHLALLLAVFAVFSLGAKLVWAREIVEIGDVTVYLPFGLWRWVPVLGSVGQAGRYAVIAYLVLAVGVACAVATLRARMGRSAGRIATAVVAIAVCVDYAFAPTFTPLPAPLVLSPVRPDRTRVLDPRLGSAETMYQQTLHARPLVGGYISRPPQSILSAYRNDPALAWLFAREPAPPVERQTLLDSLARLAVSDVLLSPGDWREHTLADYGFARIHTGQYTNVWARP